MRVSFQYLLYGIHVPLQYVQQYLVVSFNLMQDTSFFLVFFFFGSSILDNSRTVSIDLGWLSNCFEILSTPQRSDTASPTVASRRTRHTDFPIPLKRKYEHTVLVFAAHNNPTVSRQPEKENVNNAMTANNKQQQE